MENTLTEEQVFNILSGERRFQKKMVADPSRPDMIEDFHVGDGLTAINYNLRKAEEAWYKGAVPHKEAMEYLRKVAGIVVQLGERYGMPERKE
jgi:hypothetical protein